MPTADIDETRVRDILRVLCRIPIERGQQLLYHLLLEADERGVSSMAFRETRGFDQAQHRGLMSSLAGRVNSTQREMFQHDKPGYDLLLHKRWDGSQMWYTARPELEAAIARVPELQARLGLSSEAIMEAPTLVCNAPPGLDMEPEQHPADMAEASTDPEPSTPAENPFYALLDALKDMGLHYPSSLVANFLLSLQTKRFVILTGISGTGKTRIAQALARRFVRRERVARAAAIDDPRALVLTVKPYMLRFRRFILPRALVDLWPRLRALDGGGERVDVRWPGGTRACAVHAGNAVAVLLSGEAWTWFSATFQKPGQSFVVRLVGPEDAPSGLVLGLPDEEVVETTSDNYAVVPVRPDWVDARGLLGYYNPLTRQYIATPFLRLLLAAIAETDAAAEEGRSPTPFFVVLDEMNLARVERYFSDFLSALESGEPIALHDIDAIEAGETEDPDLLAVPKQIIVPANLYIVGTVNVDESTYMFSPKVLDRAFTIELNDVDLESFGGAAEWSDELDLTRWGGGLTPAGTRRPHTDDWRRFAEMADSALRAQVVALHHRLADDNRHFGYRVANEIARFVGLAAAQAADTEQAAWAALDLGFLQKVLVKLHGTQQELAALLDDLLGFMLVGAGGDDARRGADAWAYDRRTRALVPVDGSVDASPMFPASALKLWRMRRRLRERGFTAWIE